MARGNGGQKESRPPSITNPTPQPSLGDATQNQASTQSYDDTMAMITRQQYDDYMKRFWPSEQRLLDLATSDELLTNQLGRNVENVNRAFQTAEQTEAMKGQRFGLADTTTQQQQTNTGLDKALTLASAQNETRQAVGDIQRGIITGAVSNPRKELSDIGSKR